ncbi:MAG: hypothetical protein QM649_02460 [Silvibacterium sp.]
MFAAADLILTIGYDPVEYDPSIWNHAKIIHVDSVPANIDNYYQPAVKILGDIAASLTALASFIPPVVLADDVDRFLNVLAKKSAGRLDEAYKHTQTPITLCASWRSHNTG